MSSLAAFEDFTTPEMRKNIVDWVFKNTDRLSKETYRYIRDAVGHIDGFRPGSYVPPGRLKIECDNRSKKFPNFFSQVVMPAWVEAHPDLSDLVADYVKKNPVPSDSNQEVMDEYYTEQANALSQQAEGYEKDDIMVMARYHAAETDSSTLGTSDASMANSPYASATGKGMAQFLEWVSSLSADADDWDTLVPQFTSDLQDIVSQKKAESSNVTELMSVLSYLKSTHTEYLTFFQADTSDWTVSNVAGVQEREALRKQVDSLTQAFEDYSEAYARGNTLAEERERREKRDALEKVIESHIENINEQLQGATSSQESLNRTTLPEFLQEFNEKPIDETVTLETLAEESLNSRLHPSWVEEKRTLELEIDKLKDEALGMENLVRHHQRQAAIWRNSYETAQKNETGSTSAPIPAEFDSVAHVLKVAEDRFGERLFFKWNSESDLEHEYQYPLDVWNAFEWLANDYYESKSGKKSISDLDISSREKCGFWYKAGQYKVTTDMHPSAYQTKVGQRTFKLLEHIGKGASRKENDTIRIAFCWDKKEERVIMGYIGRHQPSRRKD